MKRCRSCDKGMPEENGGCSTENGIGNQITKVVDVVYGSNTESHLRYLAPLCFEPRILLHLGPTSQPGLKHWHQRHPHETHRSADLNCTAPVPEPAKFRQGDG